MNNTPRPGTMSASRNQSGITLLELMIVVVIVGILASVAYPSYQRQVLRSNRAEGKALLVDAAARQERFFSNFNTYTQVIVAPVACVGAACGLGYAAAQSENQLYGLAEIAGAPTIATTFTMQATAINRQLADGQCRTITIDALSQKASADSTATPNPAVPADPCW